jgi:hypothetical protein
MRFAGFVVMRSEKDTRPAEREQAAHNSRPPDFGY